MLFESNNNTIIFLYTLIFICKLTIIFQLFLKEKLLGIFESKFKPQTHAKPFTRRNSIRSLEDFTLLEEYAKVGRKKLNIVG